MASENYGMQVSKIGGRPAYLQNKISEQKHFICQINWDNLIYRANNELGNSFDIVSRAFMGGNLYFFGKIDFSGLNLDGGSISIYHQHT